MNQHLNQEEYDQQQYMNYNLIENERYTEREDELPLTPGDESLDEHEQRYFDTEELEGDNHSQYLVVDDNDQDPNEHSQMMYDEQSYHEESDIEEGSQQYDVNYMQQQQYDQDGNPVYEYEL